MTRTINQLRNEIIVIQKMLDKVVKELGDNIEELPQTFEVVLKLTTLPDTWGEEHVSREQMLDHFESYMFELKDALRFNDEGDEIKVVSVKEVTDDYTKLDT